MNRWFLALIVILVISCKSVYSADEIEFLYLPNDISLLPGEDIQTRVVLESKADETIEWIQVKFETSGGISIEKPYKEVEIIFPGTRRSFIFNINTTNTTQPGEKQIRFWAESEDTVLSDKYSFNITVQGDVNATNPNIAGTSTTLGNSTSTTLIDKRLEERKKQMKTIYWVLGFLVLFVFIVIMQLKN
jgi:hypothetical protein